MFDFQSLIHNMCFKHDTQQYSFLMWGGQQITGAHQTQLQKFQYHFSTIIIKLLLRIVI